MPKTQRQPNDAPDQVLERKELEAMGRRVRELLAEMSDEEREIMRLRFDEGWTARRISDELGMGGQRKVYTVIDRVIRSIRNRMNLK